ncbi:zinc ribbon domain-containing protein [Candidatus Bathyarchaeota archaeon]|nr:zinc ribbon domain-containing protein [Candidatus Bathyarchaeota archaeon]
MVELILYCPNCGRPIQEGAFFCPNCGYPILIDRSLLGDELAGLTYVAKPVLYVSDLAYLFGEHFVSRFRWVSPTLFHYVMFPAKTTLPYSGLRVACTSLIVAILVATLIELEAMKLIVIEFKPVKRFGLFDTMDIYIKPIGEQVFEQDSIEYMVLERLEAGKPVRLSELVADVVGGIPFFKRLGLVFMSHKRMLKNVRIRLHKKGLLPTSDGSKVDERYRRFIDLYKGETARALWLLDTYAMRDKERFRKLADRVLETLLTPGMMMSILVVIVCTILMWLL